jgi:hypothetical protein
LNSFPVFSLSYEIQAFQKEILLFGTACTIFGAVTLRVTSFEVARWGGDRIDDGIVGLYSTPIKLLTENDYFFIMKVVWRQSTANKYLRVTH